MQRTTDVVARLSGIAAQCAGAWAEGQGHTSEQVIAVAGEVAESVAADAPASETRTNIGSIDHSRAAGCGPAGLGLEQPQVAEVLGISTGTARIHLEHVLAKIGLRSRVQVADWARDQQLPDRIVR